MSEDGIGIRAIRPDDAGPVVALFERCYGGTYVDETFHTAAGVRAAVEAGRLRSVVAVDGDDAVVGHMGLTPCEPGARSAEMGNTVVDPRCRGRDLVLRLTGALARRCLALGGVGFVHYPTTAHPAMQKHASRGRGVELGVLVGYIPAETEYVGVERGDREGRTSVVAFWHELAPVPEREVYLPERHRERLAAIYGRAGLVRKERADGPAAASGPAAFAARFEAGRGLLRLEVDAFGEDLAERVSAEASRHPGAPALLDLPLDRPGAGAAVEALAADGFCFGALLPEYRSGGDALRLQRLAEDPPEPLLATGGGQELFAYTLADRGRAAAG